MALPLTFSLHLTSPGTNSIWHFCIPWFWSFFTAVSSPRTVQWCWVQIPNSHQSFAPSLPLVINGYLEQMGHDAMKLRQRGTILLRTRVHGDVQGPARFSWIVYLLKSMGSLWHILNVFNTNHKIFAILCAVLCRLPSTSWSHSGLDSRMWQAGSGQTPLYSGMI